MLIKLCIVVIAIFFIPVWSMAACTGASPTWTAADTTQAEVALCVTAAVSGDTINVPAGASTWVTSVSLTTKDLTITGAGTSIAAGTRITTGTAGEFCFKIANGDGISSASRITGFRFINCGIYVRGLNAAKAFRIDHNYFQGTTSATWDMSGGNSIALAQAPQGLLDHNTFEFARFQISGTLFVGTDDNLQRQHKIWSQVPGFGNEQAIYIEDNIIHNVSPGTVDCNYGGRLVYRFNSVTVVTTYANEVHGVQGWNRACQRWEVYGNTITQLGSQTFTMAFIRGGSGYYFGNTMSIAGFSNGPALKVERATELKSPFGFCDGTWIIDGNLDSGYPCRDQIGRSRDDTLYTGNYNGITGSGAWPNQTLTPAYLWNNLQAGVQMAGYRFNGTATHNAEERDFYNYSAASGSPQTVGVRTDILANRPAGCTTGVGYWATDQGSWNTSGTNPYGVQQDGADGVLYQCTATDTWTLSYTPYTYPHPLQDATTPPEPITLTGHHVANFQGATFGIFIWSASTESVHKAYNIYRCPYPGVCSILVKTITPASSAAGRSPETQYFDSSLYTSGTYYYSVSDVNTADLVGPATTAVDITVTGKQ